MHNRRKKATKRILLSELTAREMYTLMRGLTFFLEIIHLVYLIFGIIIIIEQLFLF